MQSGSIPKRVFAVVAAVLAVAAIVGDHFAHVLTEKLIPYVYFGIADVHEHSITVSVHYRHSVTFSNGVRINGFRELPVEFVFAVLDGVFTLGFWFVLLRLVASLIRRRNAAFAADVLHFWRFAK